MQSASAAPLSLKGSCLCGAVTYALVGVAAEFALCHCSRCRKSGGSAFTAELVFAAAELQWLSGGPLVKTYEAPVRKTPPGYRRTFCAECGGPLPIVGRDVIRVPAGSLDDDPKFRPERHIFVDFKAPWFDIADTLPRFSTK